MKQHSPGFLALVTESKKRIKEIAPEDLKSKLDINEPLVLIDVREDNELPTGSIPGSIHLSKGIIERDIEQKIPDLHTPIIVYCSGGFRSALVADALQKIGYTKVHSLVNGFKGWMDHGFNIQK
ncbi:rhodanese-like domain-containing protein [uncultured Legionella sp.]|uniref:rhodanese-like domain-containing protein n=1 Tax=uncultured Legionella sp. TaxID=210934 RepID=UPI002604D597|nr:rhodanese-like domain-containing protein [uncultured Legionella sp.]